MFPELKQHHIGCLVSSIDQFKADNQNTWQDADYSEVYAITAQDVRVCFISRTGGVLIELVEPGPGNLPLTKMLNKGFSFYHLAFTSANYEKSVAAFKAANCHQLSEFSSEAFNGKRCAFFFHPQLKLIELIEEAQIIPGL